MTEKMVKNVKKYLILGKKLTFLTIFYTIQE